MAEIPGSIVLYHRSMAAGVAQMFNDWSTLWPGGYGGGVPYDERRVRDRLDQSSAIADLIALDADGEPVGYCGLYPHARDRDAAYVTDLGVIPRVKGGRFGKRLLLQAVEIAREKRLRRVDLNTWPGNMDAVPLYKKTGFFWMAEPMAAVYMQNYIPALAQIPLAREWFDRHPDWYHCFQRELEQAPDRQTVDGMELYTYRFQAGEDRLIGEIDRYGWGVCGIERQLDGQRIAVKTRLRAHNILIGIPNAMTLTIENGSEQDLSLALSVEPFKGMEWMQPEWLRQGLSPCLPSSLTVRKGEKVSLTGEFVVDRAARTYRRQASEVIRSRVTVCGQVVELVTGGKIQPAVEVLSRQGYQIGPLGSQVQLYLDLRNNAPQQLAGKVDPWAEGVEGSQQSFPFVLGPHEISGLVIPVHVPTAPRSPELAVHATATVQADDTSCAMPEFRFPLVADLPELAAVIAENDRRRIHLLTDVVDVSVELEGGNLSVGLRSLPDAARPAHFQVGPPFGLDADVALRYEYDVLQQGSALTLALTADSLKVPGLRIGKYVRVTPGRREVEHWIVLTQVQSTDRSQGTSPSRCTAGGRLYTAMGGGLQINPFGAVGRSFTPIDGHVVECDGQLPYVNESAVPQSPDRWPETWTAAEGLVNGDLTAWFWKPDGIAKVKVREGMLASLESETRQLEPGESYEVFHVWYGFSFASLADVRHRWSQLVGHRELPWCELARGLPTVRPFDARWAGETHVPVGQQVRKQIELRFAVSHPLPGQMSLRVPDGWSGTFLTPDGPQGTMPIPQGSPGAPALVDVELRAPAHTFSGGSQSASDATATITLHLSAEYEMDLDLPLWLTRAREVEVYQQELEGHPVYTVANGVLRFHVLAEVGGNLIRLQDAQGRPFLVDNYPRVEPQFFLTYHIGGAQPVVFSTDAENPFMEPERVETEAISEGMWKGVRASWMARNQERLRGQRFTVSYLTLPGSGIVRCRVAHQNPTPRRIAWVGGFFLNVSLGGSLEGTVLTTPGGTQAWTRTRGPESHGHAETRAFMSLPNLNQPWACASKDEQSLTLIGRPGWANSAVLLDFTQMVGGFLLAEQQTESHGSGVLEFALAVNQPVEKAMEIVQALRGASSPRPGHGSGKA